MDTQFVRIYADIGEIARDMEANDNTDIAERLYDVMKVLWLFVEDKDRKYRKRLNGIRKQHDSDIGTE
jgi:hypothetical protein